jgi:glycosyltransferase involved in cell wall biosynthesis
MRNGLVSNYNGEIMRVLLRAPMLTNSGYGVHSRQIFEWLYERKDIDLNVECLNWGMTPWLINPSDEDGLIGKIMSCSKTLTPQYDVAIQVQLPDEWDIKLGKKNIGISAFVETDICNEKWVDACNKVDHVIVPSKFTKNIVKRSGCLSTPISVVNEWFNHDILLENKNILSDKRYELKTDFNFLIVSQLTANNADDDRKNIFNAIKWICDSFSDNDDVGIVIKTNMGKGTQIDRALTKKTIEDIIHSIGRKSFPKIYLFHGNMSSKEIAALYHHPKIKCIVSPTRGEGYGLPLIDAAAAGMPVVATNWSGHLEFLEHDLFYPVEYTLKEINKSRIDNRIFLKGFKWANPKRDSFIRNVLSVYQNQEKANEKSRKLLKKIRNNFNKNEIKKRYDHILNNL